MEGSVATALGQGAVQTGAPVQGEPTAPGAKGAATPQEGSFNWDLFPDVPEDQRATLEPHLKTVQGHVTRLEQGYAPFKAVMESGIEPTQLQGLINFGRQFDQNPLGQWMVLADQLQKAGLIDSDLDLEDLTSIVKGEYFEDDDDPTAVLPQVDGTTNPEIAQLTQMVQGLQAELQQEREQRALEAQQQQRVQVQRQQDALLARVTKSMGEELEAAGIPKDKITPQLLRGALLANGGDPQAAVQQITGFRDSTAQQLVEDGTRQTGELKVVGKTPTGRTAQQRGKRGDLFDQANAGARQMLERSIATAAQEG